MLQDGVSFLLLFCHVLLNPVFASADLAVALVLCDVMITILRHFQPPRYMQPLKRALPMPMCRPAESNPPAEKDP